MSDIDLNNKNIFITGSTGYIGNAIARIFSQKGAVVSICGRNSKSVFEKVKLIEKDGGRAIGVIMDVKDYDSVCGGIKEFIEKSGGDRIDGLINCAGGGSREKMAPLSEQSLQVINDIVGTNLYGTIYCTKAAIPLMNDGGFIINISSIIGIEGRSLYSEYAAAKAGIIGFTKSMAKELGSRKIRVNSVSYGLVPRNELNGQERDEFKRSNYLGLVPQAEECAEVVLYLAMCKYITGDNVVADGGRHLAHKGVD